MNTISKKKKKPGQVKDTPKKKPVAPAKDGEDALPKQPFLKRLIFGEEKPDLSEIEAGSTTILDILSPTAVDTKSRDYIVVDGIFHAYLYITGYGYSTTVGNGWLSPLVEAGEGISLNFIIKRQPKDKTLSKISQTTMINRSRMRDVGDTRSDYEELDSAINSGLYLKDVMNRQGEDFYYMHTIIEVTAEDPETLEQRVTAVEQLCVSVDMIARRCDYKQEQAFLSTLPVLALDPDIERKSRRNALTSGVAASFPFASYELSDKNGVFLGINMYNKTPVFLDPYDDYKYTNGNWWIGGSSGAGKTFTLLTLSGRLRQQGKRVIVIAPKKGHEFRPLCEKLGGLYLRMSPSSKDCPNLMAIRRASLDSYAHLKNLTARDDSVLADKISRLIIWFSLKKRDLSEEDKSRLDSSLVECYQRYGIDFDNRSLLDEDGNFKEMPILADWYEVLQKNPETKHLAVVLARYVTGSAAAMGGRNDIPSWTCGTPRTSSPCTPGITPLAVFMAAPAISDELNFALCFSPWTFPVKSARHPAPGCLDFSGVSTHAGGHQKNGKSDIYGGPSVFMKRRPFRGRQNRTYAGIGIRAVLAVFRNRERGETVFF